MLIKIIPASNITAIVILEPFEVITLQIERI
jgi:hypothetical protein